MSRVVGRRPRRLSSRHHFHSPVSIPRLVRALSEERGREPCYIAVRLWAIKRLDSVRMRADVVFRVFMLFNPRGLAREVLPSSTNRIVSTDTTWGDELDDALPTLVVYNGQELKDARGAREFFRVNDAKCIGDDGVMDDLWFPDPENVAMVTYKTEAVIDLDMDFRNFPFDQHKIGLCFFFPKKHKDNMYEFVCEPSMYIESEQIIPTSKGGRGILEVKPGISKSLCEWELCGSLTSSKKAHHLQSKVSLFINIRRRPQYYENKFIFRPGLIAILACLSSIVSPKDVGNRFQVTLTVLLTLVGINYSSAETLPNLSYTTALDRYHDACHNFVLLVIIVNVTFVWLTEFCESEGTSGTIVGVMKFLEGNVGVDAAVFLPTNTTVQDGCRTVDYYEDIGMLSLFLSWIAYNTWLYRHHHRHHDHLFSTQQT